MHKTLTLLLALLILCACSTTKVLMQNNEQEKSFHSLKQYVKQSETLNSYFHGIKLYDIEANKEVFAHQADHYFTPASVTKLLTLYTATHFLQDSIAWMNVYEVEGKSIYQPLGDPTFMHPNFETPERISSYFYNLPQDTIYWSEQQFKEKKYGSGWAWDDYTYSYQPQKSAFPIQSNLLRIDSTDISPSFIPVEVYYNLITNKPERIWGQNQFFINTPSETRYIPFEVNESVIKNFFVERYKTVSIYKKPLAKENLKTTIYSIPAKEAYKVLMHESDNFIAEQLLLQAGMTKTGKMNTADAIRTSKQELLSAVSDELQWVDGSGLSRYNMVTPNAMVFVVNQLVNEQGIDWVKEVFSTGGVNGTIKNYYAYEPPRVFAKTGTLRHNHNLAGIVQAKSGKWYSFCMMNNHYNGSSTIAKQEMENMLKIIIEQY